MYACLCADKTEDDVLEAIKNGATTLDEIMDKTGVGSGCGTCQMWLEKFIDTDLATNVG